MHHRLFRVLTLVCLLLPAAPRLMSAQQAEETAAEVAADTLAVPSAPSAADRLKAKLDSLRQALEDSPERRRQAVARQIATADSLRRAYDFPSAVDILRNAASAADSSMADAVQNALAVGREGLRMMSGVSQLRVTARERFSKEDFFKMFPDAEESDSARRYHSVSPDGLSLYFSSTELAGAGGYDLYVSRRSRRTGKWGEPVNMGFPYSSPYDDLLFADAGDGTHSVLASDRDCPTDSIYIYVLAYDPVPSRRAVRDVRELRALAGLRPARRMPVSSGRRASASVDMSAYTIRTAAVRTLRDSLTAASRALDALRNGLGSVADGERESYLSRILAEEEGVQRLLNRLETASKDLQQLEMSFLAGEGTPGRSLPGAPSQDPDSLVSASLSMRASEGRPVLELNESGILTRILPEGSFSEYIVYPHAPVYRVKVTVPDDSVLPLLAQTVIRLHTGDSPASATQDGATVYTTGPVTDRSRAESLAMALHATGAADVSIVED